MSFSNESTTSTSPTLSKSITITLVAGLMAVCTAALVLNNFRVLFMPLGGTLIDMELISATDSEAAYADFARHGSMLMNSMKIGFTGFFILAASFAICGSVDIARALRSQKKPGVIYLDMEY